MLRRATDGCLQMRPGTPGFASGARMHDMSTSRVITPRPSYRPRSSSPPAGADRTLDATEVVQPPTLVMQAAPV